MDTINYQAKEIAASVRKLVATTTYLSYIIGEMAKTEDSLINYELAPEEFEAKYDSLLDYVGATVKASGDIKDMLLKIDSAAHGNSCITQDNID